MHDIDTDMLEEIHKEVRKFQTLLLNTLTVS